VKDYVIVLRTDDSDVIGIIVKDDQDSVLIEHPYFIQYNPTSERILLLPYCMYTSETLFVFKKTDIKFLVTASDEVADKFLVTLNTVEARKQYVSETKLDVMQAKPNNVVMVGNDTKH
jgi:hypothetical protein